MSFIVNVCMWIKTMYTFNVKYTIEKKWEVRNPKNPVLQNNPITCSDTRTLRGH